MGFYVHPSERYLEVKEGNKTIARYEIKDGSYLLKGYPIMTVRIEIIEDRITNLKFTRLGEDKSDDYRVNAYLTSDIERTEDGNYVYFTTDDETLSQLSLLDGQIKKTFFSASIATLRISRDGKCLIVNNEQTLSFYDQNLNLVNRYLIDDYDKLIDFVDRNHDYFLVVCVNGIKGEDLYLRSVTNSQMEFLVHDCYGGSPHYIRFYKDCFQVIWSFMGREVSSSYLIRVKENGTVEKNKCLDCREMEREYNFPWEMNNDFILAVNDETLDLYRLLKKLYLFYRIKDGDIQSLPRDIILVIAQSVYPSKSIANLYHIFDLLDRKIRGQNVNFYLEMINLSITQLR